MEMGLGMDLDVARAIGLVVAGAGPLGIVFRDPEGKLFEGISPNFRPSTDWNDAMLAAERHPAVDSIHVERTKNLDWYANIGGEIAYGKTGPHAISLAIIKLAKG